jgi:hypothetical protein
MNSGSDFSSENLYRKSEIIRLNVGSNTHLVYSKLNKARLLLPDSSSNLLNYCNSFNSLTDLASSIYQHINNERENKGKQSIVIKQLKNVSPYTNDSQEIGNLKQSIINILLNFVDHGLLITQNDLLNQCKSNKHVDSTAKIENIAIVTRNRTESLLRCLSSYIDNSCKYGRSTTFKIYDDSSNDVDKAKIKECIPSLMKKYGLKILYAGLREKHKFAEDLIQTGNIPPNILRFALFDVYNLGYSPGANRNAALLDNAGSPLFFIDDDTICKPGIFGSPNPFLCLDSRYDPRIYRFYSSREESLEKITFVDQDLLSSHEQLLGKTTSNIISNFPNNSDIKIESIDDQFLGNIYRGTGKVLVTMSGVVGHSGVKYPMSLLGLEGENHDYLVRNKNTYINACTTGEVIRAVHSLTISNTPFTFFMFAGIDNREVLPPYMPILRSQDILFGYTLHICYEDKNVAFLPHTLPHLPMDTRSYSPNLWEFTGKNFCEMMISLENTLPKNISSTSGKERMQQLGKHLMDLASLSVTDFIQVVSVQRLKEISWRITSLEKLLKVYSDGPEYWKSDVRTQIMFLQKSLQGKQYFIPYDIKDKRTSSESVNLMSQLVYRYGELLYWWPTILEVRREFPNNNLNCVRFL